MKVVLIDGAEEDTQLADLSISAFYNAKSEYQGAKYIVIPKCYEWSRYRSYIKNDTVFVGMGGFDAGQYAQKIIEILKEMGLLAVVAKSINHPNFEDSFSNVKIFEEENYYDAMTECKIAITNGGLTFFQALHFGMPTIAIPQYEHQRNNISPLNHCCMSAEIDDNIKDIIKYLIGSEYYRKSLSTLSQHFVDGRGLERVCDLIEGL